MSYTIDFQLVMMEHKIARAQGKRSITETKELSEEIERLTRDLETVSVEQGMLQGQVKKAEDNLIRAQRLNIKYKNEKSNLIN